jgi:multiple sugar transport system permease protein
MKAGFGTSAKVNTVLEMSWAEIESHIRGMVEDGTYMNRNEAFLVDQTERQRVANHIYFFFRDGLDEMPESLGIAGNNFPDGEAHLMDMLATSEGRNAIATELSKAKDALDRGETELRWRYIKSPEYLLKFWNSVILVVPITVFQILLASVTAYGFSRYRGRVREIIFFSYIILMLMPYQVTLVPNYLVSDWLGILGTRWAIILPGIFSTFAIFLLTKYMRQIPTGYIEAATLDGASEWQIFTNIALPLCKNAIFALTILLFIDYWNMVEQPLVLLTDTAKQPLSVFLSQINEPELGIAFAASSVYMIPPLLIFFWGEDYLVEGISRSGIK